jgi:hypothetical protein
MSLEENLEDLRRHAEGFTRRIGFTYIARREDDTPTGSSAVR